jgi:uncharacterized protein YkwD
LLKVAAAILAVPILALVYVTAGLRRSALVRTGSAVALGGIVAVVVVFAGQPSPVAATPPSAAVPLTGASFGPVVSTNAGLGQAMTITFTAPMNPASVEALVSVSPPTTVDLAWNSSQTAMTITPRAGWAPSAYHTITVAAGALARSGQPLLGPVRASFLTRAPTSVAIKATKSVGRRVSASTEFEIAFGVAVDPQAATDAIHLEPDVPGTVSPVASAQPGTRYVFTPATVLAADTRYRVVVTALRDAEGGVVAGTSVRVRTAASPTVVRFRPRNDTRDVARDATLSVRFTAAMNSATTKAAFRVEVGGKAIKGTVTFAETKHVLVFKPAGLLPYLTKVVMIVAGSATAADGAPIEAASRGTFFTVRKPAAVSTTARSTSGSGGSSSGGGAVGGGSWGSVETYYLGLMNCTRTGGWVTSTGACSSPGGRSVAPLKLDSGISTKVSRPYAKRLAVGNDCSHFIGGNPGDRLRAAGYTSYKWAENLGCRSGAPRSAVLGSHLFFQSEKSSNGGHYVNMMNSLYDRCGIGVWVSSGRVRLVVDFYHP